MPTISWSEIRHRALQFTHEWKDVNAQREAAEEQTFWNEFFRIFGLRRRHVAAFEKPLKDIRGKYGLLDLFWPGVVLVEHKTAGASLEKSESQAFELVRELICAGRRREVPRYIVVSDFARFGIYDLEQRTPAGGEECRYTEIPLDHLHERIREFAFMTGDTPQEIDPEDPANFEATALLAGLHDSMREAGYGGADLERFLVRVLFCLFAEDTGVFEPLAFTKLLSSTRDDGSDLGVLLAQLFEVLDTPENTRHKGLPEDLAAIPYVNSSLFREKIAFAAFASTQRAELLKCAAFCWAKISPAVFGSLFQDILQKPERRQLGAHYTSERDILKVLKASFVDELQGELDAITADRSTRRNARLEEFHAKLVDIRVLDPACGCGNFLILAYRELRRLEHELLVLLHKEETPRIIGIRDLCKVDVDQFFGIEINEWPCRIAEVGLWLADHQANRLLAEAFGLSSRRIPLQASPTIWHANALDIDWRTVLAPSDSVYLIGNPPFVGKKEQDSAQKAQVVSIWRGVAGAGELDYVTCWYRKAADYIRGTKVRAAFVSTNSISQGEQVGIIWGDLLGRGIRIHFAHTTFEWESEARGKAHVHVVIIGFGARDVTSKTIYEYASLRAPPAAVAAKNINPYLADAPDVAIRSRREAITPAPKINYGSMMIDKPRRAEDGRGRYDSGLIIGGDSAREAILAENARIDPYIKRCTGGDEYINGETKWCLWLVDAPSELIGSTPSVKARAEGVREFRLSSGREQTRRLASTPTLFGERRQPSSRYLLIPKVSSERRRYVPIGFLAADIIATGSALIVPDASEYDFGVLSSSMHNAWMRYVGGRIKSDYQYSAEIVYNNFPWPTALTVRQRAAVEAAATAVLAAREMFPRSTLADLYDPVSMPSELSKAHAELDRAVEECYRAARFCSDRERVEHLFTMHAALSSPPTAAVEEAQTRVSADRHCGGSEA
jgi:hypothetical protein